MGRKRWWRGGSELLVLFLLHHVILGDGDVGEYDHSATGTEGAPLWILRYPWNLE